MLQALNTGHSGSLSTIHSNSPTDAITRLEVLVSKAKEKLPLLSIRQQIVSAVDLIVQLNRVGKRRMVTEVSEVIEIDDTTGDIKLRSLFKAVLPDPVHSENTDVVADQQFEYQLKPTGRLPTFIGELLAKQLIDIKSFFLIMTIQILSSILVGTCVACAALVLMPLWNMLILNLSEFYLKRVEDLGLPRTELMRIIQMSGAVVVLLLLLGWLSGTILIAAAIIGLMLLILPFYFSSFLNRQVMRLRHQVAEAAVAVSNSCKAGLALPGALDIAAQEAPQPMAKILSRVVSEYNLGRPMELVLSDTRKRLNVDEFTLFTAAILACWEQGGDLPVTLERIAASLKEHQRLQKKIESDTAEGRKVIQVLSIFPMLFLGAFAFLYPSGISLFFSTISGQITLIFIILAICGAIYWSQQIMSIDG